MLLLIQRSTIKYYLYFTPHHSQHILNFILHPIYCVTGIKSKPQLRRRQRARGWWGRYEHPHAIRRCDVRGGLRLEGIESGGPLLCRWSWRARRASRGRVRDASWSCVVFLGVVGEPRPEAFLWYNGPSLRVTRLPWLGEYDVSTFRHVPSWRLDVLRCRYRLCWSWVDSRWRAAAGLWFSLSSCGYP